MIVESTLTYSLMRLSNQFRNSFELKMNEIDLHGGQVFILISLWKTNEISQTELAANLALSAPTINKMVKSLAIAGFIEVFQCKTDGRIKRVRLTKKGAEHEKLVAAKWTEFEKDFFINLIETEKLIINQIFEKMRNDPKTK